MKRPLENSADIAKEEDKHPADAMLDIAVAGKLQVKFRSGLATSGDPELVGPLMSDPYVMAGVSDALIVGTTTMYLPSRSG